MNRKKVIAGNWKMNGLIKESITTLEYLINKVSRVSNADIVVCPPVQLIFCIQELLKDTVIKLGAQDCHFLEKGPYTGDISATMLADIATTHVILGHSERREYHNESSELISKKVTAAHKNNLISIVCIGETLNEKNKGQTLLVIKKQLDLSLPLGYNHLNTIIAYEPIWAIGTAVTPTLEEIATLHFEIRKHLAKQHAKIANNIRILYGGSIKATNAAEIFALPNVDGGLIGGASLVAEEFISIINSVK